MLFLWKVIVQKWRQKTGFIAWVEYCGTGTVTAFRSLVYMYDIYDLGILPWLDCVRPGMNIVSSLDSNVFEPPINEIRVFMSNGKPKEYSQGTPS